MLQRNVFTTRFQKNGYHFNTESIIYGFGYGPKSQINKITKFSIGYTPIVFIDNVLLFNYWDFTMCIHDNNSGKMTIEMDSSYTILCVPKQKKEVSKIRKKY